MVRARNFFGGFALGLGLWAGEAQASAPRIFAGEPVEPCAWPTAVAVSSGGLCSGTLIHPRVVVYAAHCGAGLKTIRFGEQAWTGGRTVAVERCAAYPNYAGATDQGRDWAYCILAEAVDALPIAPPLYGCERELLQVGEEVAIVGFGASEAEPSGDKRWALTTLAAVTPGNNTTLVGNPSTGLPSFCAGDSGGPALIQLPDGSWRTFGIASTVAGDCGGYGAHATLAGAIPWIEQDSGIDVTPCHAIDGSWAPGPACAGAFAAPANVGVGTWADWCSGTASVGASTSCGPAWDQFDPTALASVAIRSPLDGQSVLQGLELRVEVDASKHPEGFAIASISLAIDGEVVDVDANDPWEFVGPEFPGPGVYTLTAIAEDWAGNRVESAPIQIGYGTELPEPDETGGTGDEGPAGAGESGCAIDSRRPATAWTIAGVGLLLIVSLRRARSPR